MSEFNLIQGDENHALRGIKIACQTFRPTYDHVLEWVDLDLKLGSFMTSIAVLIYQANAIHEPINDYLSRNRYIIDPPWNAMVTNRIRYSMTTAPLIEGEYYAIVVRATISLIDPDVQWSYKKDTNPYLRGIRSYSDNGGDTWIKCPTDDFIFGEFGTPPAPPPPPEPVIYKHMPLELEQIPIAGGFKIIYRTNVPCHLWMRWTTTPPVKHIIPVMLRGVEIYSDIRQCFVAYHDNEQIEPGDTLTHTFIKTEWAVCETRYFIFYGLTANQEVKSTSPIFTKHRKYVFLTELIFLEPWSEVGVGPPEMELIFLEPWTHYTPPPPPMDRKFFEPWTYWLPPPFEDWIFWEPWGTYLTQYNAWKYLNDPPQVEVSFEAGIITLTNHGHEDCGIDFSPLVNYPIESAGGHPLHVRMNNTEGTANSSSTGIGLAGYFHHPVEGLLYWQLWISYGGEIEAICPYGTSPAPPRDTGWLCVGLGYKDIDLLALWKQWRTSLGKGTDPNQWVLTDFHFGLRQMSPEITDYLKNDYTGFYYSTIKRLVFEPWTE